MTEVIGPVRLDEDEKQVLAQQLVAQAKAAGIDLAGPDGLLTGLTKQVLETALDEVYPARRTSLRFSRHRVGHGRIDADDQHDLSPRSVKCVATGPIERAWQRWTGRRRPSGVSRDGFQWRLGTDAATVVGAGW